MKASKIFVLATAILSISFSAFSENSHQIENEKAFQTIPKKFQPPSFGNNLKTLINNISTNSKKLGIAIDDFSTTEENYERIKAAADKLNNNGVFLFSLQPSKNGPTTKIKYNAENETYEIEISSTPLLNLVPTNNLREIPVQHDVIYSKTENAQTASGQKFQIENRIESIYAISFAQDLLPLSLTNSSTQNKNNLTFSANVPKEIASIEKYDVLVILVCKIQPPIVFQHKSSIGATIRYPRNWVGAYKVLHTSIGGAMLVSKKTGQILAEVHD